VKECAPISRTKVSWVKSSASLRFVTRRKKYVINGARKRASSSARRQPDPLASLPADMVNTPFCHKSSTGPGQGAPKTIRRKTEGFYDLMRLVERESAAHPDRRPQLAFGDADGKNMP